MLVEFGLDHADVEKVLKLTASCAKYQLREVEKAKNN